MQGAAIPVWNGGEGEEEGRRRSERETKVWRAVMSAANSPVGKSPEGKNRGGGSPPSRSGLGSASRLRCTRTPGSTGFPSPLTPCASLTPRSPRGTRGPGSPCLESACSASPPLGPLHGSYCSGGAPGGLHSAQVAPQAAALTAVAVRVLPTLSLPSPVGNTQLTASYPDGVGWGPYTDAMHAAIDEAAERHPDSVELNLMHAAVMLRQGAPKARKGTCPCCVCWT